MTDRWRCFVAIPLPQDVREDLADAVRGWSADPELEALRWTDPDGWHVTLAFLGSIETDAVAGMAEAIRDVAANHGPMRLEVGGLGAFPSGGRARVVWLGVADADGRLRALARALRVALRLEDGSPFRGHVTLARARREPGDVREWLRRTAGPTGSVDADSIELMRSHLGRGPARYESLARAALAAPAHV